MPLRLRTMTDYGKSPPGSLSVYTVNNGVDTLVATVGVPHWSYWSQMVDSVGPSGYVRPVEHSSLSASAQMRPGYVGLVSNHNIGARYVGDRSYIQVYGEPSLLFAQAKPHLPSGTVVAAMTDEAFNAFSDQVPQEVDLVNFGLDLRELGALIPSLAENLAKTVSGGFLTYSFGWKPLIGDLKKLGNLAQTVADRLSWLKETRGKFVKLGYQSTWANDAPWTVSVGGRTASVVKQTNKFVAGCYLFHLLERLQGYEGQLRAFSSALGLLNPSAVAWERIPFSFVADWFVRTDGIVNSLKLQPFSGAWNLSRVSHSFTQVVEYEIRDTNNDYVELLTPGFFVGTLVAKTYRRYPGLPVSASILSTTGLTSGQLALAAALIGAASK